MKLYTITYGKEQLAIVADNETEARQIAAVIKSDLRWANQIATDLTVRTLGNIGKAFKALND